MEPVAYHPEKTEDPDTELVEREGLISEQQDFGYIRSTALLPDSAHRTAETFLQQTEGVLNREEYSRFDVADILKRESAYLKDGGEAGAPAKFIRNHKILVDALTLLLEKMDAEGGAED